MATKTATRSFHALVVDDSVMTRKMIMKDLQDSGLADFDFVEAGDGVDALEACQKEIFDIIFVDFQMPRKDGTEFLADLHKQLDKYPPAVMITSERSMDVLEKAAEVGVDAFMLKPVNKERLQKGLKKLIDSLPDSDGPSAVPHGECVPQAFCEILEQTCQVSLTKAPNDEAVRHGNIVFGSIAILGDVQWSVVLGFEKEAAIKLASDFAGFDIPFDSPDMGDAIGELVNVVAGQIKRMLTVKELNVEISLPVVNAAQSVRTIARRSTTCEHQHFACKLGRLWTSVTVGMNPGLVL